MGDERVDDYLRARQVVHDREAGLVRSGRMWRTATMISACTALAAVAGLVILSLQPRYIPYAIELDGNTEIVRTYEVEPHVGPVSPQMQRAFLARWIEEWRTVTPDLSLVRRMTAFVYGMLDSSSQAHAAVTDWYRDNVPLTRARTETTNIQVRHVLKLSDDSWRVEWLEELRNRGGVVVAEDYYTATLMVRIGRVDMNRALRNPLGIFITHVDFSKALKEET